VTGVTDKEIDGTVHMTLAAPAEVAETMADQEHLICYTVEAEAGGIGMDQEHLSSCTTEAEHAAVTRRPTRTGKCRITQGTPRSLHVTVIRKIKVVQGTLNVREIPCTL
jgi:hypothetical protein